MDIFLRLAADIIANYFSQLYCSSSLFAVQSVLDTWSCLPHFQLRTTVLLLPTAPAMSSEPQAATTENVARGPQCQRIEVAPPAAPPRTLPTSTDTPAPPAAVVEALVVLPADGIAAALASLPASTLTAAIAGAAPTSSPPTAVPKPKRGRPQKGKGKEPFAWRERQVEALLRIRFVKMSDRFRGTRTSVQIRDAWILLAAAVSSAVGAAVDSQQCKSKVLFLSMYQYMWSIWLSRCCFRIFQYVSFCAC